MSSRYHSVGSITVTSIASETRSHGGRDALLMPSRRRGCSGFRRDGLNEAKGFGKEVPRPVCGIRGGSKRGRSDYTRPLDMVLQKIVLRWRPSEKRLP